MRAFIAIELNNEVQKKLNELTQNCKQVKPGSVRWVPAGNIHLTLKFLGDIPVNQVIPITQSINTSVTNLKAFSFSVGNLSAFPNHNRPRVIWVGVQAPNILWEIQKSIDSSTVELGFDSEERAFSPHLTLGRISNNADITDLVGIKNFLKEFRTVTFGSVIAREVCLFRSDLRPTGAVYTRLYNAELSD